MKYIRGQNPNSHKVTAATKRKMSINMQGNTRGFQKGVSTFPGHKHSESSRHNISRSKTGKRGELSGGWRGGISTPERKVWLNNKRRALKTSNGGFHSQEEWENLKVQYNWSCPSCKRSEPSIKLTRDHVIPLSKGGLDSIENIQPLCSSCNSRKHAYMIRY